MAPRKTKLDDEDDDASSLASEVLKPKNSKSKVTKPKAEKPKTEKVKIEKVKKEVAKKEKVDGEKQKKEPVKKDAARDKDGKEKVKAVNGEEAVALMVAYLREQNRPYSATDVSANLHGKVR
jgi:26S proteasome regulatory subunit (ATPase 3-interacting protein)